MPSTAFVDARGVAVPFSELEKTYTAERWQMPLPLLKSLARQKQRYCDISVTELVNSPQSRLLRERHEYSVDPFDQVWAGFGTGLHRMLELQAECSARPEHRLLADFRVRTPDGSLRWVRLGGTVDHHSQEGGGVLTNYKCTTVFKAKKLNEAGAEGAMDWVAAENAYAYLCRLHGLPVAKLQLCLLLKDWSLREREGASNKFFCRECDGFHMRDSRPGRDHVAHEDPARVAWYPPTPIYMFELPLWSVPNANRYIRKRLELHIAAESCPDNQLPECTPTETWDGKRCEHWCEVSGLCHQRRRVAMATPGRKAVIA